MKKILLTTAFIAVSAAAAQAKSPYDYNDHHHQNWCMGLSVGMTSLTDTDYNGGTQEYNEDFSAHASLGYRVDNDWALELEAGKNNNPTDGNSNGSLDNTTLAANIVYSFPTGQVKPYVGVGAGYMSIDGDGTIDGTDTIPFYQLKTGLAYLPESLPRTEWNVGFRYSTSFNEPKIDGISVDNFNQRAVEAGVKFGF